MMAGIAMGTEQGLWSLDLDGGRRAGPATFADHRVGALARSEGALWALVDGQVLWRVPLEGGQQIEGGNEGTWTRVARLEGVHGVCVAETRAGVLVGTAQARLLRLGEEDLDPAAACLAAFGASNGSVYVSLDMGTTWGWPQTGCPPLPA
ncbi:MAG TPA: hypothetical protein VFW71_16200 [Actinomycetota bacterium]|nr:hypothetical protein [Actinomycetota bacterium]